jgi:hypothetical protein
MTAATTEGGTQSGEFYGGAFTVHQSKTDTLVEVRLAGAAPACGSAGRARSAAKRRRKFVWGDTKGRFRTTGAHGAATTRGTLWKTEELCSGTLFTVRRGEVAVREEYRHRTVIVKAGQEHLAPAACLSRRSFRIRLRAPVGTTIRSAVVRVAGRKAPVHYGRRVTARVDLRGMPAGRVTVRITVVTTSGQRITGTRTYLTCADTRRRGSIPPL